MSGGFFEYKQFFLGDAADSIQEEIDRNGKEKPKNERWHNEDTHYWEYDDETILQLKNAVIALRIAQIYMHRVDWLLSSDDGEDSFKRRLAEDLNNLSI